MRCKYSARRRGAAIVEMAFAIPILLVIMFGVIDFSVYANNTLKVANATREGARAAATGKTVSDITSRVKGFASPLNVTVKVEYSPYNLATKTYGPYVNLTDSGGSNAANADDYVRVTASVANKSTTGALGVFFNRTIEKEVIMRREKTS